MNTEELHDIVSTCHIQFISEEIHPQRETKHTEIIVQGPPHPVVIVEGAMPCLAGFY